MKAAPEDEEPDDETFMGDPLDSIQMAIQKACSSLIVLIHQLLMGLQLCRIVQYVRSSPQQCQDWYREVKRMNAKVDITECKSVLILILDVKTWWTSTHQMLCMFTFQP
jgi:hypothetical protein